MRQSIHIGTEPIGVLSPGRNVIGNLMGGAATPLTILGSSAEGGALLQWVRADAANIAESSLRVSQWNDISGNAKHYTQGTGANKPLYSASGGPNDQPYVSLDSAVRQMNSALNLPQPSTLPSTVWIIGRQNTWVANGNIVASVTDDARLLLRQRTATPNVRQFEGVDGNQNANGTLASWFRWESLYANDASAYLTVGATTGSGTAVSSAAASTGRALGGRGASAIFDYCELLYVNRGLTATEKTALDAYVAARYGTGLV